MKKQLLKQRVAEAKTETGKALQTLFDNVNKGQKKQLVKRQEIKELFDRYGVDYTDI